MSHFPSKWLLLAEQQAQLFVKDNIAFSETLVTCKVSKQIMLGAYKILVTRRTIKPLEQLSREEKRICWDTSKDIAKDRLSIDDLIDLAKALYALEYFLNL